MGFWDTITDLVEAAAPWSTADAEAPEAAPEESKASDSSEGEKETTEDAPAEEEASEEGGEDEEEEEEEDEEDEDDDEPQDQKEIFEEQCKESKQCAPAKHHYDECVERVTSQEENEGGAKEDCVEEFFHLAHCATQCAAPKLWSVLK